MIIAIIGLALLLLLLLARPARAPGARPPVIRRRDDNDGIIFGETPDGLWHGGALPDAPAQSSEMEPGGGDFGGGGASGDWSDSSSDNVSNTD